MRKAFYHRQDGLSNTPIDSISTHLLDNSGFGGLPSRARPLGNHNIAIPSVASRDLFLSLPSHIIQRILWTVDADGFASLSLINRQWNMEAQSLELYAYHLSRCPSYALTNTVITGPFRRNDLYRLKTKFAAEVRRNLFEAYMRPRETLVNLISMSASSSAAFPGGEAFRFAFSPNGHTVLALSSSRIYVLDVTSDPPVVRKELKTQRRPLSASITDDGSLLAVLSSKHQANIYGLTFDRVQHLQVIVLDKPPRTVALAHEGTVLAAAYEGGVEVFSLAANALSTDRRAVRSEAVDTLNFSGDGSMLVGSSQNLDEPNAVVITAPFYTENDPDMSSREIHSRMWTTQILFPQISSVCSHAELLQAHTEGDATWLFAYDHALMSYRAVRTDDTRTGVAYFLNPTTSRRYSTPMPSTAPTASACGTLVVAGFAGNGLSIYGVPERLDVSPDMGAVVERYDQRMQKRVGLTSATGHIEPLMAYSPSISGSSEEIEDDSLAGKVDWRQSLFVKCKQIKTVEGYTAAKWVERSDNRPCEFPGKRLVVVAPGGVNALAEDLGDESMPVDGSRICLLDFDYSPSTGPNREITIEVGDKEPELLTEYSGNLDVEVAMERRRSVRGVRGNVHKTSLTRSATAASALSNSHVLGGGVRRSSASQPTSPNEEVSSSFGGQHPFSPVSTQSSIQRSASVAGYQTARYPPRAPLGSNQYQNSGHVIYHRSIDRRESVEGWETPPPPYTNKTSPRPLQGQTGVTTGTPRTNQHDHNNYGQQLAVAANPQIQNYGSQVGYNRTPQIGYDQASRVRPYGNPNLETVNEFSGVHHIPRAGQLPQDISPVSPRHTASSTFAGQPPSTLDSFSPHSEQLALRATITHPVSPPTPDLIDHRSNVLGNMHYGPQYPQAAQQHVPEDMVLPPPTADQVANLHRRVSQGKKVPPNIITNGSGHRRAGSGSNSHDFGPVPPSPPRGAWGAAGVPGSPSFNKANKLTNGLARNNSKSSQRSIPISTSAPNLLSPRRPNYGRLDTIESMESGMVTGQGAPRSRSHSMSYEARPTSRGHAMLLDGARGLTKSGPEPKEKKSKKKKGDDGRPATALGVREKKSSRCVIM